MRLSLVLVLLFLLGPAHGSEVARCADPAGNVSYTDGACPPGSRRVGRVAVPPPAPPSIETADRPLPTQNPDSRSAGVPPRGSVETAVRPPQPPQGPIVIDPRGASSNSNEPSYDSARWSERGDDPAFAEYGYPPYPGAYRQPRPPRDMRPRIRNCDASGCQDRQGNHYDRSGQLDRYQSLDGKTCRPVGTTTVCR